ncbi:unnamed protein product [Spirodela intermedia]|uniref:Uncharacterized protein n=1 Tax=Spirodela intermedia TaxID=51605 RepID=A0A7I8K9R2_SPIIN|nr:unnamed protein product [Spirodela intermedia]
MNAARQRRMTSNSRHSRQVGGPAHPRPDGGYLLDMEELSMLVDSEGNGAAAARAPPLQKTLSRKPSHRADRTAPDDGGGATRGGAALPPATAASAAAAVSDKFVVVELAPQVGAAVMSVSPSQGRRTHGRRAAAPWLHPRRVLVFFATLSSMGTILLLYFTLSMGKMGEGDADSR